MAIFEAHPTGTEVVAALLPPGSVLRVHHPDVGVREYRAMLPGDWLIAVVPGDLTVLPWGCRDNQYCALTSMRNDRQSLDRPAWQEAVRLLKTGGEGVVYVGYKSQPYYGSDRWTATAVRTVPGTSPAYVRAMDTAPPPTITWASRSAAVVGEIRLGYWDRCTGCKQTIIGIADGGQIRVELYASDDQETVEWRRTHLDNPLPPVPASCPHCGQDPAPMTRGGFIPGSGHMLGAAPSQCITDIKAELRRRFPRLARLADAEHDTQAYLYAQPSSR
ncbi:hypothetical protein [Nonomuraea sp. NPDC023979]|uniref:hypothetical protein n=1 Tax=Nonomuraea sp. NPDC023979 TaxID=3154796 RepID=UPI00340105F1